MKLTRPFFSKPGASLVIMILVLGYGKAYGQDPIKDFESRLAVGYNTDITKKWDFAVDHEFRIDENSTRLRRSLTTFGLDYKVERWLRFGANYRLSLNRKGDGTYGLRNRFMGDMVVRGYQRQFIFSYRFRYQYENRRANYNEVQRSSAYTDIRNTLKVNYRINRMYRPYVALDSRHALTAPSNNFQPGLDRYRFVVGLDTQLSRTQVLGVYFMYNEEVNVVAPVQRFVLGAEFNFGGTRPVLGI
jgi:hypothetical protein